MLRITQLRNVRFPASALRNAYIHKTSFSGFNLLTASQAGKINFNTGYKGKRGFFWGGKNESATEEMKQEKTEIINENTDESVDNIDNTVVEGKIKEC